MILIIAAIVVATAAGIGAERRWPERAGHDSRRALVWILYLVLPPVTFFNLVHVSFDADLGGGIGLGWIATAVAALAAWGLGARVLELTRPQTGAVITCTLVANTAYLGYPLTVALLGSDELGKAVAYDVAVGGPALLIGAFAAGAAFGTKAGQGPRQRTGAFFARNMPLYAAVLALLAPELVRSRRPRRHLADRGRRDPADRLLRRRRGADGGRRPGGPADAAAIEPGDRGG